MNGLVRAIRGGDAEVLEEVFQIAGAIALVAWLALAIFALAMYHTALNAERRVAAMAQELLQEASRFLETSSNSA